jgi:hypothetical protein
MTEVSDLRKALRFARQGGGAFPTLGSIKQGVALAQKNLLAAVAPQGEVNVLGERVRLDYEKFDFRKYKDRVSFKEKYFEKEAPGSGKLLEAAKVFAKLFAAAGAFEVGAPLPPCDAKERALLEEGLENRFESLRLDVLKERNQFGDTVPVREKIDHLQRIGSLLERLDDPTLTCINYGPDGKQATPPINLDLEDEERMKRLLRTFAFLVLQGVHRIPGQDKGINAAGIVKTLEKRIITEDEMTGYVEAFNAAGKKLPSIITDVLSTTKTQPGLLEKMVATEHKALYEAILALVRGSPEWKGEFKEAFDTMVDQDEATNKGYKDRIVGVVNFLLLQFQETVKKYNEALAEADACRAKQADMAQAIKEANDAISGLTEENESLRAQIEEKKAALAASEADGVEKDAQLLTLQASLTAADARCEDQVAGLTRQIEQLTAQSGAAEAAAAAATQTAEDAKASIEEKTATIAGLQEALGRAEARAAAAEAQLQGLREQLATKERENATLTARVGELEKSLDDCNAEKETLTRENTQITGEIADVQAELATLRSGASGSAEVLADQAGKIAGLEATLAALNAAKAEINEEKGEVTKRADALQEELESTKTLLENAQEAETNLRAEMAALTETTEASVAAADARASGAEAAKAIAEGQVDGLQAQIDEQKVLIESQTAALAQANADLDAARAEVTQTNIEKGKLETQITTLTADLERAKEDCNEQKSTIVENLMRKLKEAERNLELVNIRLAKADETKKKAEVAAAEAAAEIERLEAAAAEAARRAAEERERIKREGDSEAAAASGAAAAALSASRSNYEKLLYQLKDLSQRIIEDKEIPEDGTLIPEVGTSFKDIYTKVQSLKKQPGIGTAETCGKETAEAKRVAERLRCLFTYYVNVFLHMFFFNKSKLAEGQAAYQFYSDLIGMDISRAQGELANKFEQREQATIYHGIKDLDRFPDPDMKLSELLNTIYPYIEGTEAFIYDTRPKDSGLYIIQAMNDEKQAPVLSMRRTIFEKIYQKLEAKKTDLSMHAKTIIGSVVEKEKIGRNPGSGEPNIFIVSQFDRETLNPALIFIKNDGDQDILMDNGTAFNFMIDTQTVTPRASFPVGDRGYTSYLEKGDFLLYEQLLGLFIVLCQKYIVTMEGTVKSTCPPPPGLLNPLDTYRQLQQKRDSVPARLGSASASPRAARGWSQLRETRRIAATEGVEGLARDTENTLLTIQYIEEAAAKGQAEFDAYLVQLANEQSNGYFKNSKIREAIQRIASQKRYALSKRVQDRLRTAIALEQLGNISFRLNEGTAIERIREAADVGQSDFEAYVQALGSDREGRWETNLPVTSLIQKIRSDKGWAKPAGAFV